LEKGPRSREDGEKAWLKKWLTVWQKGPQREQGRLGARSLPVLRAAAERVWALPGLFELERAFAA